MGETVIEKIIRNNVGHTVKPGDIVTVNVDRVMIHDIFIPFVAEKFEEMGFKKLWDPDKVVLIYDHLVPASQLDDTRHFHVGDAFAEKYGMKNVHRSDGIYRQSYNYLWMCRCIFFRYRIYRDGKHPRNRKHVDQSSGDDQGCDRWRTSGERYVQRCDSSSDR